MRNCSHRRHHRARAAQFHTCVFSLHSFLNSCTVQELELLANKQRLREAAQARAQAHLELMAREQRLLKDQLEKGLREVQVRVRVGA